VATHNTEHNKKYVVIKNESTGYFAQKMACKANGRLLMVHKFWLAWTFVQQCGQLHFRYRKI